MDFFSDSSVSSTPSIDTIDTVSKWRILLVDDDTEVHQITKMALKGFVFKNKPLDILSAYSAHEALTVFDLYDDIALAIIDVVMESDHAGLELVRQLRNEKKNHLTRLVLRTGQAGQAPEDKVIRDYEIDDYKEKTELTTQKLKTLLYSMLRSYSDMRLIDEQKRGFYRVLEAIPKIQCASTLNVFASSVLEQLNSLLQLGDAGLYCLYFPHEAKNESEFRTLAATGKFVSYSMGDPYCQLPKEVAERLKQAIEQKKTLYFSDAYVQCIQGIKNSEIALYVTHQNAISELDKHLLEIFAYNIAATFHNIALLDDLQETSRELVYMLSGAVEARSKETGAHVQRVSLYSELLAKLYGLPETESTLIKLASPLHDVGKVAIPDAILHKPGKLTPEEWEIMKKHVDYGVEILSTSQRAVVKKAAEIAGNHHERWDGDGYPNGLSGENIPISGRITALADVFDALGSQRSYKDAWPLSEILSYIDSQKGKQFEAQLVNLLLNNIDQFVTIRDQFPDE